MKCFLSVLMGLLAAVFALGRAEAGLVSYWSLDEGMGKTAVDVVSGNDGTLNSAGTTEIGWTDGILDSAIRIAAADRYVDCGDPDNLEPLRITVSAWCQRGTSFSQFIVGKRDEGSASYGLTTDNAGHAQFEAFVGPSAARTYSTGSTDLTDSGWHHVVGTWNGRETAVYVDGELEGKNLWVPEPGDPLDIAASTAAFRIGWGYTWNYTWIGAIDEVRIYDHVLSAEEIKNSYLTGASLPVAKTRSRKFISCTVTSAPHEWYYRR